MENSFGNLITGSKSILILLPVNPTFDQVASALSLYLALRPAKETTISSASPMLVEFNRLVGVNEIRADFGNKNLTIRFKDYKADSIEKVSYDIENGEFRLTVTPKLGENAPKENQINVSYSGTSSDTVILIGGSQKEDFPALGSKDLKPQRLARIHVNIQSTGATDILDFSRQASTISEVVAGYVKEIGAQIDGDIASNLLMGLEEGSQNFTHPLVNADTFALAAELMKAGGKRMSAGRVMRENFPVGSIPGEILQNKANQEVGSIEEVEIENAPQSWFEAPQILKGTSVS